MKRFFKILLSIITFAALSYAFMQIILIILLIPMFFIFGDVKLNPYMFYGIIAIISMVLSFFATKAIFSNRKNS